MRIADLVLERAANIKELADVLDKPKGTIGHHVGVLEAAGLIHVVRTKKIRAIEAKYYGRTARTFLLGSDTKQGFGLAPNHFLAMAAGEFAASAETHSKQGQPISSTLRYARIPRERADEWSRRLNDLVQEFASEERNGDTTYAMLAAFYPTDRPHLPDGDVPQ